MPGDGGGGGGGQRSDGMRRRRAHSGVPHARGENAGGRPRNVVSVKKQRLAASAPNARISPAPLQQLIRRPGGGGLHDRVRRGAGLGKLPGGFHFPLQVRPAVHDHVAQVVRILVRGRSRGLKRNTRGVVDERGRRSPLWKGSSEQVLEERDVGFKPRMRNSRRARSMRSIDP